MSSTAKEQLLGPIEDQAWADRLRSNVVTPGSTPRIHGYDVETDLAAHYDFFDGLLLCVLGELPTAAARQAMSVAMQFAAPISTAHAASHAAMLVRLCGATTSASFGAAGFALAEDARSIVDLHRDTLAFARGTRSDLPSIAMASDDAERASIANLRARLGAFASEVSCLKHDVSRTAALLAIFTVCGASTDEQLQALLVLSRFPTLAAESIATKPAEFRSYPITLPPFQFEAPHASD